MKHCRYVKQTREVFRDSKRERKKHIGQVVSGTGKISVCHVTENFARQTPGSTENHSKSRGRSEKKVQRITPSWQYSILWRSKGDERRRIARYRAQKYGAARPSIVRRISERQLVARRQIHRQFGNKIRDYREALLDYNHDLQLFV